MSWFAFWGKREEPKVNPLEAALLELESTRKKLELMESVTAHQLEYMRSELERAREEFAKAQAQVQELQQKAEQAQQAAQQAQQAADQAQQTAEQADQKAEDAQQQAQQDVQIPPTTEPKKKKGLFGRISSYLKELIDKEYEEIRKEEEEYRKKEKEEKDKRGGEKEDKKGGGDREEEDGRGDVRVGGGVMGKLNVVQAEVKQEGVNVRVEGDSKKDKDEKGRDSEDKRGGGKDDKADDKTKTTAGFTQSLATAVEGVSQAGSGLYKMSRALFGNMAVLPVALGKAVGRAVGDAMSGMWKFLGKAPTAEGIIGSAKNFMGGLGRTFGGLVKGVSGIVGVLKSLGKGIPGMIVDGLLKLGVMVVNGVQDLGFYLGKVFFDLKNSIMSFLSDSYAESLQKAKDKASKMPSRLGGGVTRDSFVKPVSIPGGGGGSVSGAIYRLSGKQRDMLRAQEAQGLGQFRGGTQYMEGETEEDMWGGPELRYKAEQDDFEEVQAAMRPKPTLMRTSRTYTTFAPPPRQYQYVEGRFAPPRPPRPPVERERGRGKERGEAMQGGTEGAERVRREERIRERAERRRKRKQVREASAIANVDAMNKALVEAFQLLGGNMMAIATMLASAAQILANIPKGTTMPTPPGGGGGGGGTPP